MATVSTAVAALVSSLAATAALYYTAQQSGATEAQIAQSEQSQVTSRYTAAVEQLGSNALEVRLGGIYALERIARDSPRDQATIVEVLSAYVRGKLPPAGSLECSARPKLDGRPTPEFNDVIAALKALGRRNRAAAFDPPDLTLVCLRGVALPKDVNFIGIDLAGVNLFGADLRDVDVISANLAGANLTSATLTGARLNSANFNGATLTGPSLGPTSATPFS